MRQAIEVIREVSGSDIDAVLALRRSLFETAPADALWAQSAGTAWEKAYRRQLDHETRQTSRNTQLTVVAESGNTVVGAGTGIVDQRLASPQNPAGQTGWVQGVFVAESARGRGLAPRIVTRLEEWFRGRGIHQIYLDTTSMASSMYQRLGYHPTGEAHLVKEL